MKKGFKVLLLIGIAFLLFLFGMEWSEFLLFLATTLYLEFTFNKTGK